MTSLWSYIMVKTSLNENFKHLILKNALFLRRPSLTETQAL